MVLSLQARLITADLGGEQRVVRLVGGDGNREADGMMGGKTEQKESRLDLVLPRRSVQMVAPL